MTTAAALLLLALGALVSFANWTAVVQWYRVRKHSSLIPLIGGLFGFAGCALLPAVGWKLGLLGLVIDPGCAWLLVAFPVDWIRRRRTDA